MIERTTARPHLWTRGEFESWVAGATLLESDRHGAKVYESADGRRILKLFRVRRFLSSNLWLPYAKRFAENARRLEKLEIATVNVLSWGRLPHLERQGVLYEKMPGRTLRQTEALPAEKLGRFMATLHESGVYFRSCHLGNIVLKPAGDLGLIDIMDLRVGSRPLSVGRRTRNWRHFGRYDADCRRLRAVKEGFLSAYEETANLRPEAMRRVRAAFEAAIEIDDRRA